MNKLAFFAAMAAAMGVSYDELSDGRKRLVEDVYKDHLNVKIVRDDTNLVFEAIGVDKDLFYRIKNNVLEEVNGEKSKDISSSVERFTKNAESPEELFTYGFLLSQIAYP